MSSIIAPLPCFPPVSWLSLLAREETLCIEAHENFQKGSLRNRYFIAGPNGRQRLSVPLVKGKNQQQTIREVRIAYDEPWQRQHWRSIRTAYGNAPYWDYFSETLAPFFEKKYTFLFDFNLDALHWWLRHSHSPGRIELTEHYLAADAGDRYRPLPSNDEQVFEKTGTRPYPQVFLEKHGFLPNLSCIDLLFCLGKQAAEIL